jgi:hypothetical protein
VPPEFAFYDAKYTNDDHALEVTLDAQWIHDERPIELGGKVFQQEVCIGVILREGQLENAIAAALGAQDNASAIGGLTRDCHELIAAFIRAAASRYYDMSVSPHIYEADWWLLEPFMRPGRREVGPEAVAGSLAKRVF